jgi:hypothetical protein
MPSTSRCDAKKARQTRLSGRSPTIRSTGHTKSNGEGDRRPARQRKPTQRNDEHRKFGRAGPHTPDG